MRLFGPISRLTQMKFHTAMLPLIISPRLSRYTNPIPNQLRRSRKMFPTIVELKSPYPHEKVSPHSSSDAKNIQDVQNCDRFGSLAEMEDDSRAQVHQSVHNQTLSGHAVTDSLLHDTEEEGVSSRERGLRRDPTSPIYQKHSKRLARHCHLGEVDEALSVYFTSMLTMDRVLPRRIDSHRLLDELARVGRSEDSFKVYRTMKETGVAPTQATYSRLFRACAEDCQAWFRENKVLFSVRNSTSSAPLLKRQNSLIQNALTSDSQLIEFGGPGLRRAQQLWQQLYNGPQKAVTLITYNTALLALAKGGDLEGCMVILDRMLGTGSQLSTQLVTPDTFTLTAVLSAIHPAMTKHDIMNRMTSSAEITSGQSQSARPDPFELTLRLWHTLVPHISQPLAVQNFLILLRAAIQPNSIVQANSVVSIASQEPIHLKHHDTNNTNEVVPIIQQEPPTDLSNEWTSQEHLVIQSEVNLLLPGKHETPVPRGNWLPWHRLAMFGGIKGFLDTMSRVHQCQPNVRLLTELIRLLPLPQTSSVTPDGLDVYEKTLLAAVESYRCRPDMAFYNALINRRTANGVAADQILADAMRIGLTPDQMDPHSTRAQLQVVFPSHHMRRVPFDVSFRSTASGCRAVFHDINTLNFRLPHNRPNDPHFCPLLSPTVMATELEAYVGRMVNVITSDGRTIVGTLKGYDNVINLVIKDSHERVFSPTEGVEQVPLGLFIIRGQNVALVGELDEDLDRRIDFSSLRAEPLNPVMH